jgi:hypothetical protein
MKTMTTPRSRMILTVTALGLALLVACKPDPKECFEKGDEKACQALCETGKPELLPTCYEMRARQVQACADGKGDCTEACKNWQNAQVVEDTKKIYVAKLGSDAKVAAITKACAGK